MVQMGPWLLVCPHGEQDGRSLWRANDQVKHHYEASFPVHQTGSSAPQAGG